MSIVLLLVMVRDRDHVVRDADVTVMHRDVILAERHGRVFGHGINIHDPVMWVSIAELHDS
jgi:hypothetical protein